MQLRVTAGLTLKNTLTSRVWSLLHSVPLSDLLGCQRFERTIHQMAVCPRRCQTAGEEVGDRNSLWECSIGQWSSSTDNSLYSCHRTSCKPMARAHTRCIKQILKCHHSTREDSYHRIIRLYLRADGMYDPYIWSHDTWRPRFKFDTDISTTGSQRLIIQVRPDIDRCM